jgi:alpha-mannosidase
MSTIHLISHTHWDREWYLTFQQFRLKLVHLIDRLLEILQDYPDFKYFLLDGQTILLDDYLQLRSEKEPELRNLVAAGRILIGPWYISPDEFLVAGESHIRNLLEGDRNCVKLGGKMLVGYLPDSFGHIGQMPQILLGFGINNACLWRGLDDHPTELSWKSPDGSSVLLSFLYNSYSNAAGLTTANPEKFCNEILELSQALLPHSNSGNILLMHGTDHMEPTPDLPRALRTYQQNPSPAQLIHSNLPQYFEAVRSYLESSQQILDEVTGELRSSKHSALLPNVLSTRTWLKQRNHSCENDLLKWVEPFSAWANLVDQSLTNQEALDQNIPREYLINSKSIIRYAWQLLMQCHPHDSICGTTIDQVSKEMETRLDQVDQVNADMIKQSLEWLGDHIDTRLINKPTLLDEPQDIQSVVVVFNPNDAANNGLVTFKYKLDKGYGQVQIIDDSLEPVPLSQTGLGSKELISMVLDKNSLKQALGMIHDCTVAGMVIRDFEIKEEESNIQIQATLSDHGKVNFEQWRHGLKQVEAYMANPDIKEFVVHASSDPEISLTMIARDVPGHGFRCFWIRGIAQQTTAISQPIKLNRVAQRLLPLAGKLTQVFSIPNLIQNKITRRNRAPYRIENEYFVVESGPDTNALSITDKRNQQVYHGLNRFIDSGDCGDLYNFCPPPHDLFVTSTIKKVDKITNETAQKLIVTNELVVPCSLSDNRKSRSHLLIKMYIQSEITLIPGSLRVDIHAEVDNQAKDHRLRVHFPAPFNTSSAAV